MKTKVCSFLISLCLLISLVLPCQAAVQQVEKVYDPLDLVVVVDSSGSMKDSDPQRTAVAAVRMLTNMMPADSRVGVIGFNTKATVWSQDGSGNPAMLSLDSYAGAESVRTAISKIQYNGGTGIGNAIHRATELLAAQALPGRKKAIMLFTDGVDDFGSNKLALANCQTKEVDAIQWAKANDTVIYCVGYNYKKDDGTYSMGQNGEGLVKLENIANATNGKFRSISTVKEAEQLLVDFLADVCDLIYRPVATIPGDGGHHEAKITVSPSVVEANIRIVGGDANAIKNGEIRLFDPKGNEVELRNAGNVRYDVDVNAASIKIVMPTTGDWTLSVKNIRGEDIHIGLLEHFKMNLSSTLTFPDSNPAGVAYSNDEIGIKAWMTYDGANLSDPALYDAVTSATATCISRKNPDDKKIITLQRNGLAFEGSFIIPEDSYYDIVIRLEWNSVYREDVQEVKSSNKPLHLVSDIGTVYVNKGKTVALNNIYQYVADDENNAITAAVGSSTAPDVATVTLNGDQLVITGNKWSSTLASIDFTDEHGNKVTANFKVRVNDPVAIALIVGGLLLIVAAILLAFWRAAEKAIKIKGDLYLLSMEFDTTADGDGDFVPVYFTEDEDNVAIDTKIPMISMTAFYKKRANRNLGAILNSYQEYFRFAAEDTPSATAREWMKNPSVQRLLVGLEHSKIRGSANGGSFTIKISKKTLGLRINNSSERATAGNESVLTMVFKDTTTQNRSTRNQVTIRLKFLTPVRTKDTKKSRLY